MKSKWLTLLQGANIPGKVREQLNWPGGFPMYYEETRDVLNGGFKGFDTVAPAPGEKGETLSPKTSEGGTVEKLA